MKAEVLNEWVTLIQGDCLEAMATLGTATVQSVVTDPPYCSGAATEAGRGSATHQGLRSESIRSGRFDWFSSDNMTTPGLTWLLRSMAVEADRLLVDGGSLLTFCDWRMVTSLAPAMESAGFRLRNLVVWDKGNFGCGSGFRPQHEMVLHLTKRAPEFHAANVGNVVRAKRVHSSDRDHPTEKPIDLIAQLIRVTSAEGGLILDPFAGSGTTAIAAMLTGRKCVVVEKSPGYCDVIRHRVERASGDGPGSLFNVPKSEVAS